MTRAFYYTCETCGTSWKVIGSYDELVGVNRFINGSTACTKKGCPGQLYRMTTVPFGIEAKEVPVSSFFRMAIGFESPEGKAADLSDFSSILLSKKIVRISASKIGLPERVILKSLTMDDGTVLHFDTSSHGACCFHIENPGPTCLEMVDAEHRGSSPASQSHVGVPDSNREEAGRAYPAGDLNVFPKFSFDDATSELSPAECMPFVPRPSVVQTNKSTVSDL